MEQRARHAPGTSRPLRGRVALVTGGGRGLGEAICRALAEAGATVLPADIRGDSAEAVARRLREEGSDALPLTMDVSDARQVEEGIGRCLSVFGRLDVLVNNAGVDVTAPLDRLSIEEWDAILATNLRGPFLTSKFALPVMREQGGGHIVNIVSTAALRAWPNASAYHASKWGLLGFSHALHTEARQYGVRVTAVVCGGMRTPFLLERFPEIDPAVLQDPRNVAEVVRFVLTLPDGSVVPQVMVLPVHETSWP